MLTCRTSHAKWKVNMPKCGKLYGRWTCPHVGNPMQNGRWTCQNVANTIQNGRWTCPHVVNPMQNGRWTCPNVANTMQNDKFKFQTVANTRQMVPAKKSKKKIPNLFKKKKPKTISHPIGYPHFRKPPFGGASKHLKTNTPNKINQRFYGSWFAT